MINNCFLITTDPLKFICSWHWLVVGLNFTVGDPEWEEEANIQPCTQEKTLMWDSSSYSDMDFLIYAMNDPVSHTSLSKTKASNRHSSK